MERTKSIRKQEEGHFFQPGPAWNGKAGYQVQNTNLKIVSKWKCDKNPPILFFFLPYSKTMLRESFHVGSYTPTGLRTVYSLL